MKSEVQAEALTVVRTLAEKGHIAYWAGGCVRDQLLQIEPVDFDVATSARPEEVRKIFPRTVAVGQAFGVIEVIGPKVSGKPILTQVATFRTDVSYSDGRHPDSVRYCDPREDALRRDFTINGMFFDPIKNQLIDFVNGEQDLKSKILRAIGNPNDRFREDALRMLRAVRLASRFHFTMDSETKDAIVQRAQTIKLVSPERITEELRKILAHPSRAAGIALLIDCGLGKPVFPLLENYQSPDYWNMVIKCLAALPITASFPLAFATLLIGKTNKFIESLGKEMRFSNQEINSITGFVEKAGSLLEPEKLRLCKLKKILALPWINELLQLTEAQLKAKETGCNSVEFCKSRLYSWPASKINPPPLITGNDLEELGFLPGPMFKLILDEIRDLQLDEVLVSKEDALSKVKDLANRR